MKIKNEDIIKLVAEKKLILGTFITREKCTELMTFFMSNTEIKEVFVPTEIRVNEPVNQNKDSKRN